MKDWKGQGMVPFESQIAHAMAKTIADAKADVEARVAAGAKLLDPVKDAEQIERNRRALEAALPSIDEMLADVLGETDGETLSAEPSEKPSK